jgi:hypothetical protein
VIGNEFLKVTAVSGSTWTVARGDGGSTAASHSDGDPINLVVTKEAIDSIVSVQQSGTEVANRRVLNFTGATVADNPGNGRVDIAVSGGVTFDAGADKPAAGTAGKLFIPSDGIIPQVDSGSAWQGLLPGLLTVPPAVANWTVVNAPTTVADIPGGGIYVYAAPAAGDGNHLLVRSLSPPYTVTCGFLTVPFLVNFVRTGMVIYDSVSGKLIQYCLASNGGQVIRVTRYNSTTSYNADSTTISVGAMPPVIWMRIADTGTSRSYQMSPDGLNFFTIASEASGTFLSPNRVGVSVNPNNTSVPSLMTLVSWKEA